MRFVQCAPQEATGRADDAVDALLNDWAPGHALSTTNHRHNLPHEVVGNQGWNAYWDGFFAEDDVLYGHVLGFKGLEPSPPTGRSLGAGRRQLHPLQPRSSELPQHSRAVERPKILKTGIVTRTAAPRTVMAAGAAAP